MPQSRHALSFFYTPQRQSTEGKGKGRSYWNLFRASPAKFCEFIATLLIVASCTTSAHTLLLLLLLTPVNCAPVIAHLALSCAHQCILINHAGAS